METIQQGDTVLVTGATGYIGNFVVEELIAAGYRVRGTSRNPEKAQFLIDYIDERFGKGHLELVHVPDMAVDNSCNKAVKDVAGVVHLASILPAPTAVPNEVIPPAVNGTLNILKAAREEPSVNSLAITSSGVAAVSLAANTKKVVTSDTCNDEVLSEVRTNPSPDPYDVYAASKTAAEKALWAAVKETPSSFQVASVLPSCDFGPRVRATGSSTGDWLLEALEGKQSMIHTLPLHYYINVRDDAKLHVIALTDSARNGDRIFGFAAPYTLNDVLAVSRKMDPERQFGKGEDRGRDIMEVPVKHAEALLREHYMRDRRQSRGGRLQPHRPFPLCPTASISLAHGC